MAQEVLLCSEEFIKSVTNLDDNMRGKVLNPAIREAQTIQLRGVLGDALLAKLVDIVSRGAIDSLENAAYKQLIVQSQYYIAYQALSNVCVVTAVKISPAGLEQVSDNNMTPVSVTDAFRIQDFYQKKADYYCGLLQAFIIKNRAEFPELCQNEKADIKPNLNSSANCSIWLGGKRGKML